MSTSRQLPLQPRRDAWVEINLGALERNVRRIRERLQPDTSLMAVVKADAYGHGAPMCVPMLLASGVESVAVASMDEAIQLRESGVHCPILVLSAVPAWAVPVAAQHKISLTIFQPRQLEALKNAYQLTGLPVSVQIKVDTGMHRIGIALEEATAFYQACQDLGGAIQIDGLYSHLACSDDPNTTALQYQRWQTWLETLAKPLPRWVHFSNSGGLDTLAPESWQACNVLRPGLILWGYSAYKQAPWSQHLEPVMGLKARITHVQALPSGEGVSYGHRFVTRRESRIATLPLGYADGVPRGLSQKLELLYQGKRVPQVGTITMDQMMVDITDLPQLTVGDTLTLLGQSGPPNVAPSLRDSITLEDWAQILNTIPYELMCGLRVRLPRIYVRD
jgi:alanine racemase